jgi:hypothetical protein
MRTPPSKLSHSCALQKLPFYKRCVGRVGRVGRVWHVCCGDVHFVLVLVELVGGHRLSCGYQATWFVTAAWLSRLHGVLPAELCTRTVRPTRIPGQLRMMYLTREHDREVEDCAFTSPAPALRRLSSWVGSLARPSYFITLELCYLLQFRMCVCEGSVRLRMHAVVCTPIPCPTKLLAMQTMAVCLELGLHTYVPAGSGPGTNGASHAQANQHRGEPGALFAWIVMGDDARGAGQEAGV